MLETALSMVKMITEKGYEAYIVGGFVRDYLLGIESQDIDINTNATPKEIKEIFESAHLPTADYGSMTVIHRGIRFEVTTFRKEIKYENNRKPIEIEYISDLKTDLLRRDFIINTLCMNDNGEIIDKLNGRYDIENKILRTVGDSNEKFSEDALRILRAVRFSTNLDFELSDEIKQAIIKNKELLKNISYNRKREELDKIFVGNDVTRGIKILLELGLDKELEIDKLKDVKITTSLMGIWAILDVEEKYPFNKNEKQIMKNIKEVLNTDPRDPIALFKYDLYVCSVGAEIKGISRKEVTEAFERLPIKKKEELDITADKIIKTLNIEPGFKIKEVYKDVMSEVLYKRIKNEEKEIITYIKSKYQ